MSSHNTQSASTSTPSQAPEVLLPNNYNFEDYNSSTFSQEQQQPHLQQHDQADPIAYQQQHIEQQHHQQLQDQYVLFDTTQLEQLASDVAKARAFQPSIDKLAQILAEALETDKVIKGAFASNILQPHPFTLLQFTDYIKDSVDELLTLQQSVHALESDMQQLQEVESSIEQAQKSPAGSVLVQSLASTIAQAPSILARAQAVANILQPAVEAAQQLAQYIPYGIAQLAKLQSTPSAQTHHCEVTHSCKYCGMPFNRSNSLTDHILSKHTDHAYKC